MYQQIPPMEWSLQAPPDHMLNYTEFRVTVPWVEFSWSEQNGEREYRIRSGFTNPVIRRPPVMIPPGWNDMKQCSKCYAYDQHKEVKRLWGDSFDQKAFR